MIGCGIGIWPAALGGGASAFNPVSLFGGGEQGVVYDLTNIATMFQERTGAAATTPSGANGPIGTLKDLSPNNNYAIAPSDAARPLSRQGVGAPNVYGEGDGVDDYLTTSYVTAQPVVMVSCLRIITSVNNRNVYDGGASHFELLAQSPVNTLTQYAGAFMGAIAAADGEDLVLTQRFSGATSRIAKNNGAYTVGNAGSSLGGGLTLFSGNPGTGGSSNMRLYRLVKINRDLTDSEIAQCRTWCGAAAGLVL